MMLKACSLHGVKDDDDAGSEMYMLSWAMCFIIICTCEERVRETERICHCFGHIMKIRIYVRGL